MKTWLNIFHKALRSTASANLNHIEHNYSTDPSHYTLLLRLVAQFIKILFQYP